ncbi:MAG: NAD-dependent epimerase/dehydratase family protein [Nitrospiraceae bacterium]|nr:MAG: NAD-dependent epimerase/dehydratase family protein [Nitrospiraceae bacterium]
MNRISNSIYQFFRDLIIRNRSLVVIMAHLVQTAVANYLAFMIRFDYVVSYEQLGIMLSYLPFLLLVRLALYLRAGLYKDIWSYSSISDMMAIVKSVIAGSVIFFLLNRYLLDNDSYPQSIYVLDCMLLIIMSGGSRLFIRVFREYLHSHHRGKKILVIGAGDAGEKIVRDINNNPKASYEPIGFIDDDPYKKGLMIRGVPIFGPVSLLPYVIETGKPEEILVTISSNDSIRKVYELCKPYNIPIKKLPGLDDILDGNVAIATRLGQCLIDAGLVTEDKVQQALVLQKNEGGRLGSKLVKLGHITEERLGSFLSRQFGISHMKPISLEDLLQREPVRTDIKSVRNFIENKSVLVTGAGGSIGSELCRQIIKYGPSNLVLFDRYENNLFRIDLELRCEKAKNNGKSRDNITSVIGDIIDASTLEYVFSKYNPQIVFHAAAHKHVPMMEHNPVEAVRNNILGTNNLLDVTARHNGENFVMISTDKAVNPTSIMGATKRVAELLTISKNASSLTKFTTVRFGNVLGSNGSVVPIFREQLKNGGPLTVTHPEIKRFFMLIPEAVQLVLLAASSGNGGEIFVLDMGNPIKIGDLAENIIRLSGFIPHKEIRILYTGLRPGEKLYEELFDRSEKIIPTFHEKLRIAVPAPLPVGDLSEHISSFEDVVMNYSVEEIVPLIEKIVPDFRHEQNMNIEQMVH